MNFFADLLKASGNEDANPASEGVVAGDVNSYISTGCYALNALLSGSIFAGLPSNRIIALAGEEATGKTFFALSICKNFLESNPTGAVMYFESESSLSKDMIETRGIDSTRFNILPVTTVQEFRTQALKIIGKYNEMPAKERPPMIFVLDSLGMLSTTKEIEDTVEGKETRDMTRAQVLKAAFRVLTLKLGKANVPLIVTNHTYDVVGSYFPAKEMSGGSGLKYAASQILFLSKRKEKDGTDVVGNIITVKNQKSRITIENKKIEVLLNYKDGLNKYYGLLEIAEKYGVIKKVSTRYELSDGPKCFGKNINEEPEKYFTEEILKQIDQACLKEFKYGEV